MRISLLLILTLSLIGCARRTPSADINEAVGRKHYDSKEVEFLLKSKPSSIELTDEYGQRPLQIAAGFDRTSAVTLLLKHRADVNAVDDAGRSALHTACHEGHADVAKQLIAAKASVGVEDQSGSTPLHKLVAFNASETELLQLLLNAGADVRAVNADGKTPIDIVVENRKIYTTPSGDRDPNFDRQMIKGYDSAEALMREAIRE